MFLLLVLIAASELWTGGASELPANKSTKLVEKIRRQLMENNYDYLPTEDEWYMQAKHYDQDGPNDPLYDEQPQARDFEAEEKRRKEEEGEDSQANNRDSANSTHLREFVPRAAPTEPPVSPNPYGYDNLGNQITTDKEPQSDGLAQYLERNQMSNVNNINYVYNLSNNEMSKRKSADPTVSKNDLLYYMDETKMKTSLEVNDVAKNPAGDVGGGAGALRAKYKVIQVKNAKPNRRSNVVRRFIQEETPDGVAIISLDGSPFPEFHLPRARRQYMLDRDEAELSDERRVGPGRRDEAPIYDEKADILEENHRKEHYRKRYRFGVRKHHKRTRNNTKKETKRHSKNISTKNSKTNSTTNSTKNSIKNSTKNHTINHTKKYTKSVTKIYIQNTTKTEIKPVIINIQRRSTDLKIDPNKYKPYSGGPRYI